MKALFISILVLLLSGCADTPERVPPQDTSSDQGIIGLDQSDTVEPEDSQDTSTTEDLGCSEGAQQCYVTELQRCEGGVWVTEEDCGATYLCDDALGCMECNPIQARVCDGIEVRACTSDGRMGDLVETCEAGCVGGNCEEVVCPTATQSIYVVDSDYNLLRFNPSNDAHTFDLLGTLDCPASTPWSEWGGDVATPFSMSVDRQGRAWVLYTSGEIFWVDPLDPALSCTRSGFQPGSRGFQLFGMGFVSDTPGSTSEHLYIVGGDVDDLLHGDIGVVDPTSLAVSVLGPVPNAEQSPELTGSGAAGLYGYFPGFDSFVAELSKENGAILQQWEVNAGSASAWAFAHWGGKFYIFMTNSSDRNQVLRLTPSSGLVETIHENHPYRIVGAGVSTCAPWN